MATLVTQTDRDALLQLVDATLQSARAEQRSIGLIVLQVRNYDRIASAFGFAVADRMIDDIAELLERAVRKTDTVRRLGESKFAIVLGELRNHGVLMLAATKLDRALCRWLRVADTEISVVSRIGMAIGPSQADAAEDLLRCAETALLTAVADEARYVAYSPDQRDRASESLGLELELEAAVEHGELELWYQPKVAAQTGGPVGAEALLRWNNPRRGFISPDIFIPLAEKTGAIETLTAFVINTAIRQSAAWPRHWGPLSVSVNVTPRVLESGDLAGTIESALSMWDGSPERFCIEITEGAIMRSPKVSLAMLRELRSSGLKISIDDFGTGYSSLSYFKNIPADELKIDKSFVLNMLSDEGDRKIVRAVVDLAKAFGLSVTAEGVEDQRTAAKLAEFRCDWLQGYYYSKPLPQRDFLGWLERQREATARSA